MPNKAEQNLSRYLHIEKILNTFFIHFDFCIDKCIRIEIANNGGDPVSACCKNKYYKKYDLEYPAFELLKSEREKLYGKPDDHCFKNPVSPCEYHNPISGCLLKTHKSPICLAFMCRESIEELRNRYNIYTYDYLGMNYALEWILTGDFSDKDYYDLEQSILNMTESIITTGNKKNEQHYRN